ncbi:universal stress protein [Streptomyces sp. NPDC005728]|uniref:universal stress protein n=1 Tax=Streptomyces sp. NPDC005728 TaxID=3157054 RepID=UPI0034046CF4
MLLVVGVDGSASSLRAVDWAADTAARRAASLRLVHASLWERYEGASLGVGPDRPYEQVLAEDIVETAERRARDRQPGVRVTTEVLPEEPESALVRESRTALAVVLGSRGRSGLSEALLGSVGVTVAGRAHCPVIVLRGSHDNQARSGAHGRIVVGVADEPAGSAAALRFAAEEARLRGVPLEAVHAGRHRAVGHLLGSGEPGRPQKGDVVRALSEVLGDVPDGLEVRQRSAAGRPRDALLAASCEADLLVVGARRRPSRFGPHLGRVAHGVLHHAACPVAVIPELSRH